VFFQSFYKNYAVLINSEIYIFKLKTKQIHIQLIYMLGGILIAKLTSTTN